MHNRLKTKWEMNPKPFPASASGTYPLREDILKSELSHTH